MPTEPAPMLDVLRRHRSLSILAPHPDDEVLGCYGLIRQAQALGMPVQVHIATDGERCFGPLAPALEMSLRQHRRQESEEAARRMGYARPVFWELGDTLLSQQTSALQGQLAQHWQADALWVTTWWDDGHPDHGATGQVLRDWGRQQDTTTAYYPIWALMDAERNTRFMAHSDRSQVVLTTAQNTEKKEIAKVFASQFRPHAFGQQIILAETSLTMFTSQAEHYLYEN